MNDRYCAICESVIPKCYSSGAALPNSRYKEKKTCSPKCAARLRTKGPVDYAIKNCKVCGEPISKYSSGGLLLRKSKYDERRTCDKDDCKRKATNGHKAKMVQFILTPMDLFLRGEF